MMLWFYKYYAYYYRKIGENFYGWKACVYIQASLIFINAFVAIIWQLPNLDEIATSSLSCNVAGYQQEMFKAGVLMKSTFFEHLLAQNLLLQFRHS